VVAVKCARKREDCEAATQADVTMFQLMWREARWVLIVQDFHGVARSFADLCGLVILSKHHNFSGHLCHEGGIYLLDDVIARRQNGPILQPVTLIAVSPIVEAPLPVFFSSRAETFFSTLLSKKLTIVSCVLAEK